MSHATAAAYTENGLCPHALELLLSLKFASAHLLFELTILPPDVFELCLQLRHNLIVSQAQILVNLSVRLTVS